MKNAFISLLVVSFISLTNNVYANEDQFIINCMKEFDESVKGLREAYIQRWQYKELCECKAAILRVELHGKNKIADIPNRNAFFERLDKMLMNQCYIPLARKYGWKFQVK